MHFALTYAAQVFDTRGKLMGRQQAGLGFLRAALAARPRRIDCHALDRKAAQVFAADVAGLTGHPPEIQFIPWTEPGRLAEPGLLYRADPGIAEDGWRRRAQAGARAYSLCGVTHTISSHGAMAMLANLASAPLYPWDAVICTSTAARDVARKLLEAQAEYLRARLGATQLPLPQLPLIPLGVHVEDFAFVAEKRAQSRAALGLGESDVAALFVGRLVFHGKAHPLPMFAGLERAAQRTGKPVTLILFGQSPNIPVAEAFKAEAARFAPSVRLIVLDGGKEANRIKAFAAADLFTSLSDNIQETFGLTPLEAMAAGLPVVVSDWDGYKDTVRDGIDGFRVRTLAPPPGAGGDMADRYDLGLDTYDIHIGAVSQFVAVDVESAAWAYAQLIADPELRARMGAAGQARARQSFDWSVVFARYVALWEELAERRRADPLCADEQLRTRRPDRPDPFTLFASFPTGVIGPQTRLSLVPGSDAAAAEARRALASVNYASASLPPPAAVARVLAALAAGAATQADVAAALPARPAQGLARTTAWLIKMGLVNGGTPK